MSKKTVQHSEVEWQEQLTSEQYKICRKKGTEAAFSGLYNHHYKEGVYHCVCCQQPLFSSDHKYDSGSGWPSYSDVIASDNLVTEPDYSNGRERIEIKCSACDAHLGHVFSDEATDTGLRYCVNSTALTFENTKEKGL